jgi:hypothetical protein
MIFQGESKWKRPSRDINCEAITNKAEVSMYVAS